MDCVNGCPRCNLYKHVFYLYCKGASFPAVFSENCLFFQVRYLYVVSTAEVRLRYGWSTAESLLNFFIFSVTVLFCLPLLFFHSPTGQYKRTSNNMRFPNVRGRFWSFVVLLVLLLDTLRTDEKKIGQKDAFGRETAKVIWKWADDVRTFVSLR
jgi:hypothetical protein